MTTDTKALKEGIYALDSDLDTAQHADHQETIRTLVVAADRLAALEAENQRLLEALEGVLGEALTYQLRESDLVVETARAAIAKAKGGDA